MIYYIWVSLKVFVSLFLFSASLFFVRLFYELIPEWITRKWGKEKGDETKKKKSINPLILQFTLNEKYKKEVTVQQN